VGQQLGLALERLLALVLGPELVLGLEQVPELVQGSSRRSAERWCRLPAEYWF
jgi:hypothetical protein